MKKLGILLVLTVMFACSCEMIPNTDVHYIDEDFVLIEKNEGEKVVDGNTKIVRFHVERSNTPLWTEEKTTTSPRSITPEDVKAETSKNMTEVEADLRALEIEREIMALEREKESLNK